MKNIDSQDLINYLDLDSNINKIILLRGALYRTTWQSDKGYHFRLKYFDYQSGECKLGYKWRTDTFDARIKDLIVVRSKKNIDRLVWFINTMINKGEVSCIDDCFSIKR